MVGVASWCGALDPAKRVVAAGDGRQGGERQKNSARGQSKYPSTVCLKEEGWRTTWTATVARSSAAPLCSQGGERGVLVRRDGVHRRGAKFNFADLVDLHSYKKYHSIVVSLLLHVLTRHW